MGRVRISPPSPSKGSHIGDFCPRLHEFGKEACSPGADLDVGARWKWAHRATSRLYLGTWLTTIRDTIRSSRAIPRPSSSSSREKIKNIGRRVMLGVARVDKSACHRRVRARARLLRAVQGRGQRVLAMRTRAWPAPAAARLVRLLLREGAARRLPAARASTLRAAQTRRYRSRAPPAAAKRQVVRLPPCRRPPRARRGPHPRSRSSKHPSLSPCSLARTARLTMS